jgi:cupin superfamily protein DUF985
MQRTAMHKRAKELISELSLQPHPEGGHFREIFRSPHKVQPLDERSERSALTTIYFLLVKGQHGRWHRVTSDEAWHFYEGDSLEVYGLMAEMSCIKRCSGEAGRILIRRAWSPLGVGKRQGLSEITASWDATLLPDSSSKISRCCPKAQQRSHTSHRCVLSLPALLRRKMNDATTHADHTLGPTSPLRRPSTKRRNICAVIEAG